MRSDTVEINGMNNGRKKGLIIFICAAVVCLLIILSILYFLKLNVFSLSPQIAKMFTGEYPEEFCLNDGENSSLYQSFTHAHVDKNGNLILIMTDKEIENWKNSNYYLQLLQKIVGNEQQIVSEIIPPTDPVLQSLYEGADVACGYEISEDYTQVYADPDDSKLLYFPLLPYPCIVMQVLAGKASDEICYTFIEYDEAGEVANQFVWPDDFS